MNAGPGRRVRGLGYGRRRAAGGPARRQPDTAPAGRSAAVLGGGTTTTATALAATLGLAAACWVVAVRLMSGMSMGAATRLGSFAFFSGLRVVMMAAMMLPGAASAVLRRARASGRVRAVPLFAGSRAGDRIRIAVGRLARRAGLERHFGGTEETDVHGTVTLLNWQGDVAPGADFDSLRYALEMVGAPLARDLASMVLTQAPVAAR